MPTNDRNDKSSLTISLKYFYEEISIHNAKITNNDKKKTMIRACLYINLESRGDIETSQSSRVRESCFETLETWQKEISSFNVFSLSLIVVWEGNFTFVTIIIKVVGFVLQRELTIQTIKIRYKIPLGKNREEHKREEGGDQKGRARTIFFASGRPTKAVFRQNSA